MNQKLPYEELIAKKLRELHPPDREAPWQKMHNLLNEEMPVSEDNNRRAYGRWKNIGLLALLLTGGLMFSLYFFNQKDVKNKSIAGVNVENQNESKNATSTQENISATLTPGPKEKTVIPNTQKEEWQSQHNLQKQPTPDLTQEKKISPNTIKLSNLTTNRFIKPSNANRNSFVSNNNVTKNETGKTLDAGVITEEELENANISNSVTKNLDESNTKQNKAAPVSENDINHHLIGVITDKATEQVNDNNLALQPSGNTTTEIETSLAKLDINTLPELQGETELSLPDNLWQLPNVSAKKKAILKEMKRRERKEERELSKSYKTHWSFWGNHTDRWFAAGIAPYQNFSIASQQTYNYNSGAGKSMIADYIPSPYLQLHVTDRIYLLSEFQFNSPQATPNLLLAQNNTTVPMNNVGYTENIYLRKLYYFNMPLSFYYSPVKNFYLGSGIQFSSFNSGLAYSEQRSVNNTVLQSQTFKIKDDSLSSKINASEWRYLFDANYYVDRFMFGFRYNQALNNFVNLKVNNLLPPTQARNQAFQFYIRYNLIVSKKH